MTLYRKGDKDRLLNKSISARVGFSGGASYGPRRKKKNIGGGSILRKRKLMDLVELGLSGTSFIKVQKTGKKLEH